MKTAISILVSITIFLIVTAGLSMAQWTYQSSPLYPNTDLGKVQFVTDQEGWISAGNGSLLHTTDGGTTWTIVTPYPNDTIFVMSDPSISMWWVDKSHGWMVGSAGTGFQNAHGIVVYFTTDGGATGSRIQVSSNPGDIGFQVQFVNDTLGWLSGYNLLTHQARLYRTTNGGQSWTLIASPPTGGIFYFVDSRNGWGVNNSVTAPPPYGIVKTTDGGDSWTNVYPDTTAYGFYALQFLDGQNGWVIGGDTVAQIIKTTDGGSSWKKVALPPSIMRPKCLFFLNPDTGWVGVTVRTPQGDQPAIIFTNDGGTNWWIEQIPPQQGAGHIFSIYFRDLKNGYFTQEQCVANCNGPDSLRRYAGLIGHTTNNGGITRIAEPVERLRTFRLYQNYPNPFNPFTVISFEVPFRSHVKVALYDALGREVKVLVDEYMDAGNHFVKLDASNLASGVYFYQFIASPLEKEREAYFESRKLVLMK